MTSRTSTCYKKSRAGSGSLCEPRKPRKTVAPTTYCCFFSTCRARECGWLLASATSAEYGDVRGPVLPVVFFPTCGQAIGCGGAGAEQNRERCASQISQDSRSHISSCAVLFTPVALVFPLQTDSSIAAAVRKRRRRLQRVPRSARRAEPTNSGADRCRRGHLHSR